MAKKETQRATVGAALGYFVTLTGPDYCAPASDSVVIKPFCTDSGFSVGLSVHAGSKAQVVCLSLRGYRDNLLRLAQL